MSAHQLSLFDPAPALDAVEAFVRSILESRKRANASGQLGEDAANIRAAYFQRNGHSGVPPVDQTEPKGGA